MGKYFSFSGVATRSEFWAVSIIALVLSLVLTAFSLTLLASIDHAIQTIGGLFIFAVCIGGAWLAYATTVRRCRDSGLNPWWTLATIIPYIGFVVWIVIGVLSTKKIDN